VSKSVEQSEPKFWQPKAVGILIEHWWALRSVVFEKKQAAQDNEIELLAIQIRTVNIKRNP